MDTSKLDSIVSEIDKESRQPSPSHNNLARLTAMFCREMIQAQLQVSIPFGIETTNSDNTPKPKGRKKNA